MNSCFEKELKQALEHVQPPEGFAERVLDRLPAPARKKPRLPMFPAMAAIIVLAAGLAFYWHQHQERERVEKVQQQLTFALRLTTIKLTIVEARLRKSAPQLQMRKDKEQL